LHDGHPDYNRTINQADEALYLAKQGGRNCSRMYFEGKAAGRAEGAVPAGATDASRKPA